MPTVTSATEACAVRWASARKRARRLSDGMTKDLVVGSGRPATGTPCWCTTSADYALVFDSSHNQPVRFPSPGVVPRFAKGIEGMKVGKRATGDRDPSRRRLRQGRAPSAVAPDETLVFVVDLKAIE